MHIFQSSVFRSHCWSDLGVSPISFVVVKSMWNRFTYATVFDTRTLLASALLPWWFQQMHSVCNRRCCENVVMTCLLRAPHCVDEVSFDKADRHGNRDLRGHRKHANVELPTILRLLRTIYNHDSRSSELLRDFELPGAGWTIEGSMRPLCGICRRLLKVSSVAKDWNSVELPQVKCLWWEPDPTGPTFLLLQRRWSSPWRKSGSKGFKHRLASRRCGTVFPEHCVCVSWSIWAVLVG